MGNRGKVDERNRARELRADAWTLVEIADELGVSKSSVSLWVRDVEFEPRPRRTARRRGPNVLQRRKQAEIDELEAEGLLRLGRLNDQAFLAAGAALYAGDGSKTAGGVRFANSNPEIVRFYCSWLRQFFDIDESRLRVVLYLHKGLDLPRAVAHWAEVTGVPAAQFGKPYRAEPDPSIRHTKHEYGCAHVRYSCARTHRAVMGLIGALLSSTPAHGPG